MPQTVMEMLRVWTHAIVYLCHTTNYIFMLFQGIAYMEPCGVAGIGTAFPASERDVSEEQQMVLIRAVGTRSLRFPVLPG